MDSRDPSQTPTLCAGGCGFLGNPETSNLCSKCYRDLCLKKLRQKAKKLGQLTVMERVVMLALSSAVKAPASLDPVVLPGAEPPKAAAAEVEAEAEAERCGRCPKRLKLCSRYKCRCGSTFCTAHRLPETHGCNYDFKAAGAAAIAKANPVVVESKLERLRRGSN